jgi:competence protein ComFC
MSRTGLRDVQGWLIPVLQGAFGVWCVHCQEQTAHHRLPICRTCASEIPFSIYPLRLQSDYLVQAWCMAPYKSVLGSVIRRGKYAGQRSVFEQLGYMLAGAALDLPEMDAVVSVPLPNHRRMKRGFNQSALLARSVSRLLAIPQYEILSRVDRQEQASRTQTERRRRLTGRFEVRPHFDSESIPKRIVIVDDVITTGATAESCALELLNLGVQEVYVLALVSG